MRPPLVSLTGLPDEAAHAQPDYGRPIAARDKCPRCGVRTPLTRKLDGPIPLFEGTRSLLAPIWSIQPYLVGRTLYEAIHKHLPPHWVWEVLPDRHSAPVDPIGVKVRPRHCPAAHADGYTPQRCRKCEQIKYPKGSLTYIVRSELPAFPITQTRGGWFIAEKRFAARLLKQFPRKLRADPFEVRDCAPAPHVI